MPYCQRAYLRESVISNSVSCNAMSDPSDSDRPLYLNSFSSNSHAYFRVEPRVLVQIARTKTSQLTADVSRTGCIVTMLDQHRLQGVARSRVFVRRHSSDILPATQIEAYSNDGTFEVQQPALPIALIGLSELLTSLLDRLLSVDG